MQGYGKSGLGWVVFVQDVGTYWAWEDTKIKQNIMTFLNEISQTSLLTVPG